jgi:cytochrome oxidase Cu insertion factor (SCO1/SenC/PrrC family)
MSIGAIAIIAALALTAVTLVVVRATSLPLSTLPVGVATGNLAPDFHLTDAYDRPVSRSSLLADKPGLLFFTTTYCLPCVKGLRELVRFQGDVGADRFTVLVVFIDPSEPSAALRAYQQDYGFPRSWYYAFDTDDMGAKYRIRALDTKFVLDRRGVIRFTDVYPATYEIWRHALALVGVTT